MVCFLLVRHLFYFSGINGKRQVSVASGSGIAFFAKLSKDFKNANQNQTIVFDQVITNKGSGYHSSHGIFTCTTPGLYVFSTTLLTNSPYAQAKLMKNEARIEVLNVGGHWEQASHTVVIDLEAGDLVSIESETSSAQVEFSGFDYSSFSGFLLYDYSDVHVNPIVGK